MSNPWERDWGGSSTESTGDGNPWDRDWGNVAVVDQDGPAPLPSEMVGESGQSFLENFGKSFLASFYDTGAAGWSVLENVAKPFSDEWEKTFREYADQAQKMGQDLRETGQLVSGLSDAGFDRGVEQDSWGAAFGSGAGSLVPIFATGGAAGVAGLGARAAGAAVYGTIGLQEFGSSYQTARQAYTEQGLENGLSEEEAIDQAGQKAMLPAVSRAAAVMLVTKAGAKVADKIGGTDIEKLASTVGSKNSKEALNIIHRGSGIAKGAAIEGGEEATTTYIGDYFIARASYDPDATWQEVSNDAYKAFWVGTGIGAAAGTVQTRGQRKSPEDAAKRDTMRKVAPATAARLDERDSAAARVLPEEGELEPAVIPLPEGADQDADVYPQTARDKLVKEIEAKGNMPAWWSRYEGTAEPEGTLGPSGLRFADQETVDRFIEDQEAFAELSKMSVEEDADGNFIVSREGEQIDIFESQAEAEAFSRKSAIQRTPKKIRQRIARFKGITKNLRELEQLEAQKKAQLDEMQNPAEQRDVLPEEITEEDKQFVAERLGISPEDLQFSGLRITPEMVSQLRFAPEEGVSEFLRQAEAQRVAQEEAAFFEARQREEESSSMIEEAIDRKIAEINEQSRKAREEAETQREIEAQTPRVEADQTEQARAMREGLTPDTNQLSEFAEEQLEGGELTPSARTILNRLLDRKANLIVDSVEAGESQQQNILESLTEIDRQIAGLLSDQVRPADTVTPEQLNQLQQSVGAIEPPAPPASETITVGGNTIRITDSETATPAGAASPLSQRAQTVAGQIAAARMTAEAGAKADAAIAERELQAEREANRQAQQEQQPQQIEKQQLLEKITEALGKIDKRFKGLIGLDEIKFTKQKGGAGVYSLARNGITSTILVDPERLANTLRTTKKFSLEKALEEELIHNLDGQALRAEYARQIANGQLSPTVSLPQFIRNRYTEVANGMTNQERAAARQIYGNEFIDDIHMAQEFVRQLIQQRHTKSVTEDSYRSGPIRRLLALFSRAFQRMNLSAPLKSHVAQVESFLERTYKAEIADADTAAAKQRLKDERAARQAEKKQRKQAKRDAADKLENDHAEAYEKIQKAVARNGMFDSTSNDYQLAVDKAYDAWRRRYEKGEKVQFSLLALNAVRRVLSENNAQKRGSGQVDSLDKLYEEGFNPSVEFTLAGQKTLDIISANKDEIGLVDNELKYLHYFLGGEPSQQVMAAEMNISEGRVSQIKKKAIQKLQNYSLNNPSFASALIDSATNPNDLITAAAAIGAADPNIGENRVAELVAAQKKYEASSKTRADWDELNKAIEDYKTIIDAVPVPTKDSVLTEETIKSHLEIGSLKKQKSAVQKGRDYFAAKKRGNPVVKKGDVVDVRIDIPIYQETGDYVVTIHKKGEGIIGYDSFIHLVGDITFIEGPDAVKSKIAKGEARKSSFARVRGEVASVDVLPDVSGKEWTQVGFDPERHSYYYSRQNPTQRVVGGKEAVSIGNTVFVRDAVMEDAFDAGVAYAADPNQLNDPSFKAATSILSKIGDFKNRVFRIFSSDGGLKMDSAVNPDKQLDFHQKKIERDGYVNSVMGEVKRNNRILTKLVKKHYGKPTEAEVYNINDALGGDQKAIQSLPPDIADVVGEMRQQIDGLSGYMLSKGWFNGDLKQKIEENLQRYVARSYRIFDDPEYAKKLREGKIDPTILTRAEAFLEKQLIANGESPASAQVASKTLVQDILTEYSKKGGREQLDAGKLGQKDVSLFMKRKDIAPEIRALLGEYRDPVINYTRSITRMAHFVANHRFLSQMKEIGMGEVFFEESDFATRKKYEAFSKIPDIRSNKSKEANPSTYDPLAGLYTTELGWQILNDYRVASSLMEMNGLRHLIKANVLTKTMATVFSPMTQSRNLQGQPFFSLLNGHNPFAFKKAWKAIRAVLNDGFSSDKELQIYFNKMSRLGLVGEEMTTAELKRAFEDHKDIADAASAEELLNKGAANALTRAKKKLKKISWDAAVRIYRASDEVGKIMNFEMERELLKPLYPELSEAELDTLAAQRTRGGVPTYSELPPAVQVLRAQPIVGPFMAFAYEAARTQINNVRYAVEEFKRGGSDPSPSNPHTRYAARRIGGHLAVTAAFVGVFKYLSEMWGGVSEEEQEAVRSMMAPYEKKSQFLFWREEDGTINHVNVSYNNPYSATIDPLVSLMGLSDQSADSFADAAIENFAAIADPFTSETILAKAVIDLARNETDYGTRVWNPEADKLTILAKQAAHIGSAFVAGGVKRPAKRWVAAYNNETLPSGEKPNLRDEITAEFTGYKLRTIDYQDKLTKTTFGTKRRITDANSIFNRVGGSRGSVDNEEMINAYRDANESRLRIFRQVHKQVRAALLGGTTRAEVFNALKAGGISKIDAQFIMRGYYRPMDISESVARRARQANHPIPRREVMEIKREYLRKPLDDEGSE